ncbi:MAG: Asp-tRNA(Asn)/Glu-tRNA(Gln) amidotransferase subunit GatC [bacterium]|nr:Asp-tRNA(Asn)/Glu-tRNA(Gln) amidotransferase subunit GatC [bacterium]
MDKEKVLNLAKLARISISEEEAENLSSEFDEILKYVDEINKAEIGAHEDSYSDTPLKNVFREDTPTNTSGENTEAILQNSPQREGNYIKVKNIL